MFMGLPRMKFISGNFVRSTAFSYTVKITLGSFLYSLFMELSFFNKVEDAGVTNLVYYQGGGLSNKSTKKYY